MENTSQTTGGKIEKVPLTCIICPMGCSMEVEVETNASGQKKVLSVKDNGCKRGEQYAAKELQNPTRTLTTTIKVEGGELPLVPVKTDMHPNKVTVLKVTGVELVTLSYF